MLISIDFALYQYLLVEREKVFFFFFFYKN